ncbi:hypothetical protein [Sphingomonas sp.]|jgi:hypothetical protein|uniref:hypothetical protein n=1 Tax=Sphingomonas sp. TaxID=28214 RepID=UPI002DF5FB9B|nr:hypothetical protein [Sphingomonas sp.]
MPNNQYGDFQTPPHLSQKVVELASRLSHIPETIIEPTCGVGSIVKAALDAYPDAAVHGIEIQAEYAEYLKSSLRGRSRLTIHNADYFTFDWDGLIARSHKPLWILGNPPWVTNTFLAANGSSNLPTKSPQAGLRGIEAQTGKSNFDISESMIRDWFSWSASCNGTLAVICKQSVARKVLLWWWKAGRRSPAARVHLIDAKREFGASVSACVLVCSFAIGSSEQVCDVYSDVDASSPSGRFGYVDGALVSDERAYRAGQHLLGAAVPRWRSGIKHDARLALELTGTAAEMRTLDGSGVCLEPSFIYPLRKGSDLKENRSARSLIVPQMNISDDRLDLQRLAPRTWSYLQSRRHIFDARRSVIYKKGGPFSVFGVGPYTFLPWKVAIGALYKELSFYVIGPEGGKPVVFDDTVYFLSFHTEEEARKALKRLEHPDVQSFLRSMIFWDDMRPVKTELLNRLNLNGIELH